MAHRALAESLRLLTPNWHTRLPGHATTVMNPTASCRPPRSRTLSRLRPGRSRRRWHRARRCTRVRALAGRLRDQPPTTASGAAPPSCWPPAPATCQRSRRIADAVPPPIASVTPLTYRDPDQLPDGGVLVVGASATGVQLADEIHRRAAGHARRRRARPDAPHLPGPRHLLVDGRSRRPRPSATTSSTTSSAPATAVTAAHRHPEPRRST